MNIAPAKTQWHSEIDSHVIKGLSTDTRLGLSSSEAERRLARYGHNKFEKEKTTGVFGKIFKQIRGPLVLILLIAGVVTLVLGEYVDATVIFIAITINVVVGVFQEGRASKAFSKLSNSQQQYATVVRDGIKKVMQSSYLVPGDIVILEAGSYVPADVRILENNELSVNESILTGEWVAVDKEVGVVKAKSHLSKQVNMAFMGTLVVSGIGRAVVVKTGHDTEVGSIAESLKDTEDPATPIQKNIRKLAKFLAYLVLTVVAGIFIIGIVRGEAIGEMLLLSIAVAVSVIPEGLPAAVTVVLAVGMERILDRKGLVKNLLAAETLGSTTVILTDKTGTLTQALMKLEDIVTVEHDEEDMLRALKVAVLASDAFIESENGASIVIRGRPVEKAIIQGGLAHGINQNDLLEKHKVYDTRPFDSEARYAATLYANSESREIAISGAPELLLENAGYVLRGGEEVVLNDELRKKITVQMKEHAEKGSRLIAVGYVKTSSKSLGGDSLLHGMVFAGFLGFNDPLREDVPQAIKEAHEAGARIIMLTGDNAITARAIAQEAGITDSDDVLTGDEVENMSDKELTDALKTAYVFARVLPSQKLRIARLLQAQGEVVAMTGDGINDAPALRRADIGIAVGSGSEVAKEAADLVLLDNSFPTIISAIEEGRRIIDNLKKVLVHLLSTDFHAVFVIGVAIVAGLPLPVIPVQILWVNIIEEGLLTFAFAFEPSERGSMKRNPHSDRIRNIMTKEVKSLILMAGIITGIFSVALFLFLINSKLPIEEIRTIMFVVLSLDAIFFSISLKHLRKPFWHANLLNNKYLLFSLFASMLGIVATLTIPPLRDFLSLVKPNAFDVVLLIGVAIFNLITIEFSKKIVFAKA